MKIQYASDLHLEFPENKQFLKENPIKPVGDILVLAGDIVLFSLMKDHTDFFKYLSDNFQKTYWIAGNHEYYHTDVSNRIGTFKEEIAENVFLVNNLAIKEQNVDLLFTTLWSNISAKNELEIKSRLSDFHVITINDEAFRPKAYNLLHQDSLVFLINELTKQSTNKRVVVSHHVPTIINYPSIYLGSKINEAFVVDLTDLIESNIIDAWIYGHSHFNTPDFKINDTLLLTNQLGYVVYNEHGQFNRSAILEI